MPISIDEQVAGAIYLGQHLRDVAAVLSDLRARLMISAAVAMPLSALAGLALARTITRPVQSLTVAAGKLSSGDYAYPIESSSEDELGRLSHAFVSMRERLRGVEKMRTQFVSDVSHELRTPLTAIKGLAETLRDGAVDDANVRDRFLASIESETDRLIRLVNDLLTLTRADSQALQIRRQTVDLFELAKTIVEKLETELTTRNLELQLHSGFQPLEVCADPDRVEQILFILLDNALKHTPPGGRIVIEGRNVEVDPQEVVQSHKPGIGLEGYAAPENLPPGKWSILRITDNGEGIPPDDLPHVFERFYRADQARSRDRGGSGLGLSIAKALIEAHGGRIWLESPPSEQHRKPGAKGTAACLAFPESTE
ncbi:MAG: HAMP domain-containing protein [Anaerolineales bacterium]|nr:HAMP domain-containing protein [Anaerolineales bacterium]